MKSITGVYLVEADNIGDAVSSPLLYFRFKDYIRSYSDLRTVTPSGPIIIGGGGLLHEELEAYLENISHNPVQPKILWGIGSNYHRGYPGLPEFLAAFDLVGLRDYTQKFYHHVPCASCMSKLFAFRRGLGEGVVVYEHHAEAIPLTMFPKRGNQGSAEDFERVINFLASGETVITNSYHGIYWSLLLGRKVVCWKPFSTRFHTLQPEVSICNETNWQEAIENAKSPPDSYLQECRAKNIAFYELATKLLF